MLGVLVLLAIAVLLFIAPNYREAKVVRGQVADLEARVATLTARTQAVDHLEEEVRAAREHAANDLKIIPETPDVAGLIRKLSDQIDGVNIVDQTFTAGTPGEAIIGGDSTAMAMPVAADMRGTFESAVALIRKAESMSRLVRVSSVRLLCKREEQKAVMPLLTASVGLEVIYDTLEKPPAKTP